MGAGGWLNTITMPQSIPLLVLQSVQGWEFEYCHDGSHCRCPRQYGWKITEMVPPLPPLAAMPLERSGECAGLSGSVHFDLGASPSALRGLVAGEESCGSFVNVAGLIAASFDRRAPHYTNAWATAARTRFTVLCSAVAPSATEVSGELPPSQGCVSALHAVAACGAHAECTESRWFLAHLLQANNPVVWGRATTHQDSKGASATLELHLQRQRRRGADVAVPSMVPAVENDHARRLSQGLEEATLAHEAQAEQHVSEALPSVSSLHLNPALTEPPSPPWPSTSPPVHQRKEAAMGNSSRPAHVTSTFTSDALGAVNPQASNVPLSEAGRCPGLLKEAIVHSTPTMEGADPSNSTLGAKAELCATLTLCRLATQL